MTLLDHIDCDNCISHAKIEIVLADAQILYSCKACVPDIIKDYASTENPVRSIVEMEEFK